MSSEGYIAEVILFAGNFAPKNYSFCNGNVIFIASNTALFSLLGTYYGGDGRTTFALPNCQGRKVIGVGQGPGLPNYQIGETGGTPTVTLTTSQMPVHTHQATGTLKVTTQRGTTNQPGGAYPGAMPPPSTIYSSATDNSTLASDAVQSTVGNSGLGQPFSIEEPYIALNYIICLYGIYPPRP